jgi:putative ABC transport system permease protein
MKRANIHRSLDFLRWFCPSSLYEGIEGDLLEQFEEDKKQRGEKKAKTRLAFNVIKFLRPGIVLRNKFTNRFNPWMMLRSNMLLAYRHLMKSRMFSIINVSGLAIGVASFLLIVHYVRYEYSYEDFHTNAKNIYRITLDVYKDSEFVVADCEMYAPVGPMLADKFPEVKDYVRFYEYSNRQVKVGEKKFNEGRIGFADPSMLSIFSFHLLQGDAVSALNEPFQVVITESMARKYFGRTDVMGEQIDIALHPYKITGVISDPPLNTHLKVDFFLSHVTLPKLWNYNEVEFQGNNEYTYLLMDEHVNGNTINQKLKEFSLQLKDKIDTDILVAQPISEIHLYSNKSFEPEPNGNARTVNFLVLVAIFILIIAWINYINLSTARAVERAREVGIRKVMGSFRTQLVFQFLSESVIVTLLACLLAGLLVYSALPFFADFTGQSLSLSIFRQKEFWYALLVIFLSGSFLAGLYPAFVLSSFKPASVLKGKFQSSMQGQWLRKGLVIFQFASAVILIICLVTVYRQINFLQQKDLGMSIDQILVLRAPAFSSDSVYLDKTENFKNALLMNSSVESVSHSGLVPGMSLQEMSSTNTVYRVGHEKESQGYYFYVNAFDEDFISTFKMKLLAGRNFSAKDQGIIINEEALNRLGFANAEEAIGSKVFFYDQEQTVIGVLKNFYHRSPKEKYLPMIFWNDRFADYFSIRVKSDQVHQAMSSITANWNTYFPDNAFDYFFLDERFNQQYQSDQQFGKLMGGFSLLAAVIASLGLFGLSSYTIVQHMKEIGIRKVLGASVTQIVQLLSKDFLKLVVVSAFVAVPFAYFAMEEWLSNYATRIQLGIWIFVIPSLIVLLIAAATVSVQTIQAAKSNPVNSLKNE